jgi:hypothetical protein
MSVNIVMDKFGFPSEVISEIEQQIPVAQTVLGGTGLLDCCWTAFDNHMITLERKAIGDFVNRVDDLEIQLRNAFTKADEVALLIEGVLIPIDDKCCFRFYQSHKSNAFFPADQIVNRPYKYYMGFIYRLDKLGVTTYWTANGHGTAQAMIEFVQASNKAEYTTFKRYIRKKPSIPYNDDPLENVKGKQIVKLMGMGLGEKQAETLINKFGTVWQVIHADRKAMLGNGIGDTTLDKFFEGLGRV